MQSMSKMNIDQKTAPMGWTAPISRVCTGKTLDWVVIVKCKIYFCNDYFLPYILAT